MDLTQLQDELDSVRPEDSSPTEPLTLLTAKLGQMAEGKVKLSSSVGSQMEDDEEAYFRRDMVAGLIFSCIEYGEEYDLDLDKAIEERLDMMKEMQDYHDEVAEAKESGDAKALADALDADANEVPTGKDTDDDGRGVY